MIKKRKIALTAMFLILLLFTAVTPCVATGIYDKVVVSGFPFGIRLDTDGVAVANLGEVFDGKDSYHPAADAGLRRGDIINSVNGTGVDTADRFKDIISKADGESVLLIYTRDGKKRSAQVKLKKDADGNNKIGIWIRSGAAGIGTLTFINPETLEFGGLGHGISISDSGEPMNVRGGKAVNAEISGINPGKPGTPGELRGTLGDITLGSISKNTRTGIFGKFDSLPDGISGDLYEIAEKESVKAGRAYLLGAPDGMNRKLFSIEITGIEDMSPTKNFSVKVTDPELLSLTGGIVQGMSGTPIIQDGKLIGALTHVMVNDPQRGYGIFIENMLSQTVCLPYISRAA